MACATTIISRISSGFVAKERASWFMAKTWTPKNDAKAVKAFAKAMRALVQSSKGGRRHPRPR